MNQWTYVYIRQFHKQKITNNSYKYQSAEKSVYLYLRCFRTGYIGLAFSCFKIEKSNKYPSVCLSKKYFLKVKPGHFPLNKTMLVSFNQSFYILLHIYNFVIWNIVSLKTKKECSRGSLFPATHGLFSATKLVTASLSFNNRWTNRLCQLTLPVAALLSWKPDRPTQIQHIQLDSLDLKIRFLPHSEVCFSGEDRITVQQPKPNEMQYHSVLDTLVKKHKLLV